MPESAALPSSSGQQPAGSSVSRTGLSTRTGNSHGSVFKIEIFIGIFLFSRFCMLRLSEEEKVCAVSMPFLWLLYWLSDMFYFLPFGEVAFIPYFTFWGVHAETNKSSPQRAFSLWSCNSHARGSALPLQYAVYLLLITWECPAGCLQVQLFMTICRLETSTCLAQG